MKGQYYKKKETVQEYIHLAKDVSGIEIIEKLKKVLPPKSTLLELGSGPGTDCQILSKTYIVTGSDYSHEFLKHLKSQNVEGEFSELDAVTIETDKMFDGIYSNKVLHHLIDNDLMTSIKRQSEILNPNGIICHTFWKGDGSEIFKGLFVNYHTKVAIQKFFENEFDILSLELYQEFEEDDSILLVGRKK